ncbi:hypothetical protein QE152_g29902 [Popillia japonica]|uniref:Transposase n=1 Tax=Popillia japonica TaxID=7064 RepID=A0AAW1JGJ0_POPJA
MSDQPGPSRNLPSPPKRRQRLGHLSHDEKRTIVNMYKTLTLQTPRKGTTAVVINICGTLKLAKSTVYRTIREYQRTGQLARPKARTGRHSKLQAYDESVKNGRFQDSIDGSVWKCYQKISFRKQARRVCGTRVALRTGTFFARSKLSLQQILGFINLWVRCLSQTFICVELKLSQRTAVDWASFCREACLEYFMYRPTKLGGPGIVVEIDESKFRCGMVWPVWGWCGPVWSGVTRLGSVWPGLGWCGLVGVRVARLGVVSPGWGRCGPVWDGVAWLGFVWPGLEWCHPVGVGVARFGMVWPGWGSYDPA